MDKRVHLVFVLAGANIFYSRITWKETIAKNTQQIKQKNLATRSVVVKPITNKCTSKVKRVRDVQGCGTKSKQRMASYCSGIRMNQSPTPCWSYISSFHSLQKKRDWKKNVELYFKILNHAFVTQKKEEWWLNNELLHIHTITLTHTHKHTHTHTQ